MKTVKVDTNGVAGILDVSENPYQDLNQWLNDWPEHVVPRQLPKPFCMMVAESGCLRKLEPNFTGIVLYGGIIVGDVYFLKDIWDNEGCYSVAPLTDEEAEGLFSYLQKLRGSTL